MKQFWQISILIYVLIIIGHFSVFAQEDIKTLEGEIVDILKKHNFSGGYAGFLKSPSLTSDDQYRQGLKNFKTALEDTKKVRSFKDIDTFWVRDSAGETWSGLYENNGETNLWFSFDTPSEALIAIISSDPANEPVLQDNLRKTYGAHLPLLKAAKNIACSGKKIGDLDSDDVKDFFSKLVPKPNVSSVDHHDDGGDITTSYIYLNSPPPKKRIRIKQEYDRNRLTGISVGVFSPSFFNYDQDQLLADMSLNADCILKDGQVWTHNSEGIREKLIKVGANGLAKDIYWVNREIRSMRDIYQTCEVEGKTFDQILKLSNDLDRVIVSVLDTGIDYNHPDLAYKIPRKPDGSIKGWDYYGDDALPYHDISIDISGDIFDNSHGTHVAGIAAKESDDIEILPIRYEGGEKFYDAVELAHKEGSRIMNISLSSNDRERWEPLRRAMRDYPDMLFVVSAGNNADDLDSSPVYPATYNLPNMIAVAAVDDNNNLADFSNYGKNTIHIGAPGVDIRSSIPEGGQGSKSGTSMAAPYVTNIAAKIKAINPKFTTQQIKDIILDSAQSVDNLSSKVIAGGVVDLKMALALARERSNLK